MGTPQISLVSPSILKERELVAWSLQAQGCLGPYIARNNLELKVKCANDNDSDEKERELIESMHRLQFSFS